MIGHTELKVGLQSERPKKNPEVHQKKSAPPPQVNFGSLQQPVAFAEPNTAKMATPIVVPTPLLALPEGWTAEKDIKTVGKLSGATQRTLEPVGPYFLAHARRARHKRTFSEDDRIQAQERAKKVENDEDSEISEPEDPMMLARDAKDWKVGGSLVCGQNRMALTRFFSNIATRPLQGSRSLQVPLEGYRGADQACPPQEGPQAPPR